MNRKKILVIGGTGMLGHAVHKYFDELGSYEMFNSVYRTLLNDKSILCDVKDPKAVQSLFKQLEPDIVINCVGALVQESKEQPASAIYLNALFPHILKELCDKQNAKLIHVSTDCVFSGKKGNYTKEDFRDADDVYGRSKALGEIFDEPHCTLRTSIIGPELRTNGSGLFNWFTKQKGEVNGYSNVIWSGVTTWELARCMDLVITNNLKGLHHVTNGEAISKYHLLKLIKEIYNLDLIELTEYNSYKSNKSLVPSKEFNFEVKSYIEMLHELKFKLKQ